MYIFLEIRRACGEVPPLPIDAELLGQPLWLDCYHSLIHCRSPYFFFSPPPPLPLFFNGIVCFFLHFAKSGNIIESSTSTDELYTKFFTKGASLGVTDVQAELYLPSPLSLL